MSRTISDVLRIFRLAIGRRNTNDPDSSDGTLLQYINDFVALTMSDDVKVFEQFGTLSFEIDETITDGIYIFPGNDTSNEFVNIGSEAIISLLDPVDNSVSWNRLQIFQDPGEFYGYWGINNSEVLNAGFPTQMLYYGNEFVFRTIPDTTYLVNIYGYKKAAEYSGSNEQLAFDHWLRYVAYGAALDYAMDYSIDPTRIQIISKTFARQRELMLTRTHNQIKISRCVPRF
jgi:hypothetical protein